MRKRIICCFMAFGILLATYIRPASAQQSPQTIYTGEAFSVSAGDASDIQWSLKRDNTDVPLTNYIEGALTNSGGTIRFPQTGMYTLIASITDATGRVFTKSQTVSVQNALNCDFNLSTTNTHIKNNITVTMDAAAYTGGKTISWSLTKGGSGSTYIGTLNNDGGTINVTSVGSYTLSATISNGTDAEVTCSSSFTVYNNPPNTPVITRSPNGTYVGDDEYVTITAAASDPDGDSVTYVWENRPSQTYRYSVGYHTVRVKAVDPWGAESAWVSTGFTVRKMTDSSMCGLQNTTAYTLIYAPDGASVVKYRIFVEGVAGYTSKDYAYVRALNKNTQTWDIVFSRNDVYGVDETLTLSPGIYTALHFTYITDNPIMHTYGKMYGYAWYTY